MDLFTYALAKGGQGSGGTGVTVDSVLSDTSENPVQNKVLKAALDSKAASADVPTKVSDLTNDSGFLTSAALSGYATESELEGYVTGSALETALNAKADTSAVNAALALKANSADVTAAIAAAIGSVSSFEYYLCGAGEYDAQTGVPTVQNPDTEHIYLVPTSGSNLNMYAYIGSFTFLGTTEVDLSGYAQTADLADVATSGSYEDLDDKPDIPTKLSELDLDVPYAPLPYDLIWERDADEMTLTQYSASYFGNNTDPIYNWAGYDVTEEDFEALAAIADHEKDKIINWELGEIVIAQKTENVVILAANLSVTSTGAPLGFDRDDADIPFFGIEIETNVNSPTGYKLNLYSSFEGPSNWFVAKEGYYLTEKDLDEILTEELATKQDTLTFDNSPSQNSSNPVKSGGVYTALAAKQDTLTFDNSPTANSNNPVKSGGVYTALAGKQATLTFDSTPTSGSSNPVKSKGIYTALAAKANTADLATVATSGSYNDLSNKPTIPTIPEKLVTGSAKAYTVVVANSAPSAGTADSVITIVV